MRWDGECPLSDGAGAVGPNVRNGRSHLIGKTPLCPPVRLACADCGAQQKFAPTNAAFEKLPAGMVDTLVKPESKQALTGILTYHVVSGRMTAADLTKAIEQGGGTATLKTVAGGSLTATQAGGTITLKDAKGGTSAVTQGDVLQSNGVIHVIDTVLMPS